MVQTPEKPSPRNILGPLTFTGIASPLLQHPLPPPAHKQLPGQRNFNIGDKTLSNFTSRESVLSAQTLFY